MKKTAFVSAAYNVSVLSVSDWDRSGIVADLSYRTAEMYCAEQCFFFVLFLWGLYGVDTSMSLCVHDILIWS